ncbi:LADA_0C09802g1_1 [Lachancea dasiensis]|uniref:LADA_0C09802g1_1 n=1 Tax=Lachancea dasiensis TaxID=1072105 RepID=A0A1G4J194_9SACH|nr:LADA_0C09802g1_1 [Lachancea dasiensis]
MTTTKSSNYKRFQYILKRTLERNVVNGHIRNKSDKSTGSRSSSDSLKRRRRKKEEVDRQGTEHTILGSKKAITTDAPQAAQGRAATRFRAHQKANSASSLYRRSFISLRGNSSAPASKTEPQVVIRPPSRPPSVLESSSSNDRQQVRISSSPISPSYTSRFRRQHKSSSSESSIFNSLFGSNNGVSSSSSNDATAAHQRASINFKSPSLESLAADKTRSNAVDTTNRTEATQPDEKTSLWGKLKRKSVQLDAAISQSTTLSSEVEAPDTKTLAEPRTVSTEFKWDDFLLDKKYYPLKNAEILDRYILVTKDNRFFTPLNVGIITNLEEFKDSMALSVGIRHRNFTIHLTDFGCDIGCAISDDLLETMRNNMFYNIPNKFFLKDQLKFQLHPTDKKADHEVQASIKSNKSKGSVKSTSSSVLNSNDDNSTATSCSDVTSFDDIAHATGRVAYPRTPNSYYGAVVAGSNTEVDYWTFKDSRNEEPLPQSLSRTRSRNLRGKTSNVGSAFNTGSVSHGGQSFQVIRKRTEDEIDFNNRRSSPYTNTDFAPKRDAPKPPSSSQTSLPSSGNSSATSSPKIHNGRKNSAIARKARPPPPAPMWNAISSKSSNLSLNTHRSLEGGSHETIVHPYTPASTQILVPQPYKGKSDSTAISTDDPTSSFKYRPKTDRSNSTQSTVNASVKVPPQLLKRSSTKRIVSSASAADNFDENEISFADAPRLSDSDQDDDQSDSSSEIIWSSQLESNKVDSSFNQPQITLQPPSSDAMGDRLEHNEECTESFKKEHSDVNMTLRPPPEVVYENLERFFPGTDLDRPIVEGNTPPPSPQATKSRSPNTSQSTTIPTEDDQSPFSSRLGTPQTMITDSLNTSNEVLGGPGKSLKIPKRSKTIRIIAREASEAGRSSQTKRLKRKNTKMWGTRVVEVTDKRTVAINKSKNSKGEYKEFAWIRGEIIGRGSFGSVFLGMNVTAGEMIAVKQVEVPRFGSQDETALNVLEALRLEVATLKNLDHTNIVQYLGFEDKNHVYSLFLEYVAGGSVGALIRHFGRFDEKLVRFLAVQVLRGLSYLHSKGILHRDMKADNLLLDVDGVCKISDFGISRKSNNIYTNSDMTMRGTVFWMAPEMVDTKQGYSAKVDIWSLGCVVLEMFAGKRPWSNFEVVAAMLKIGKFKSAPPIPDDIKELISPEAKDFLDACFNVNPDKRPTADQLLTHPFCKVDESFVFQATNLAKFIRYNDKGSASTLVTNHQAKC